jgi:hypothetical protein
MVTGKAPLDVAVDLLGISIKEFCYRIGIDDRTYRRWRSRSTAPNMTLEQAKKLDVELKSIGFSIHDLPNVLTQVESA